MIITKITRPDFGTKNSVTSCKFFLFIILLCSHNILFILLTLGVLKAQNKKSVRSESKLINKSMEHLVEKEGWPAGGLIELR